MLFPGKQRKQLNAFIHRTFKEMLYKNNKNKLFQLIRAAKEIYYDKKIDENKTAVKQTFKYLDRWT